MDQKGLGEKWRNREEFGGIYRFMQGQGQVKADRTGSTVMGTSKTDGLSKTAGDEFDMASLISDSTGEEQEQTPVEINPASAKTEIIGMLDYAPANAKTAAFNLMADLLKLPVTERGMEMDDKIMWMISNLKKLDPASAVQVYRAISSGR